MQRSRWDIMASVLRIAKRAEAKTHIMYRANLSHRQLERYLELLLDQGLLRVAAVEHHSRATEFFAATDRGLSFLKAYRTLQDIVREKQGS